MFDRRPLPSFLVAFPGLLLLSACAASSSPEPGSPDLDGGLPVDTGVTGETGVPFDAGGDGGGLGGDVAPAETGSGDGTTYVYAHTDTDLYSLNPATDAVTKVGPFTGGAASITDLAINGDNQMFVNSTTEVYTATLPAGGTGPVALTLKSTLPAGSKFYALAFVNKGVLTPDEALIAGDDQGDLYYIDVSSASPTPQKLGSFGAWQTGDPNPSGKSTTADNWALSGDLLFYMDGTTPRGLATVRTCYTTSTGTTKCYADNDAVVEVDMGALKSNFDSKGSGTSLRKRFLGGAAGTGRLFGLGAWGDKIYAFSRHYAGSKTGSPALPPELVIINGSGVGSVAKQFGTAAAPDFTNGWSGAGVTTKAKVSVIK
ncbi:MAG: hypothetical protein NVS3B10_07110 [Polyangiales bacterium]